MQIEVIDHQLQICSTRSYKINWRTNVRFYVGLPTTMVESLFTDSWQCPVTVLRGCHGEQSLQTYFYYLVINNYDL